MGAPMPRAKRIAPDLARYIPDLETGELIELTTLRVYRVRFRDIDYCKVSIQVERRNEHGYLERVADDGAAAMTAGECIDALTDVCFSDDVQGGLF